jgi:hypothetical protein
VLGLGGQGVTAVFRLVPSRSECSIQRTYRCMSSPSKSLFIAFLSPVLTRPTISLILPSFQRWQFELHHPRFTCTARNPGSCTIRGSGCTPCPHFPLSLFLFGLSSTSNSPLLSHSVRTTLCSFPFLKFLLFPRLTHPIPPPFQSSHFHASSSSIDSNLPPPQYRARLPTKIKSNP